MFTTSGGWVQAIDASTGDRLWGNDDVEYFDGMTVETGTLYGTRSGETQFGNEPSHVFAFDASEGGREWVISSTTTSFSRSPAVVPGTVAVCSLGGDISVLNRDDGGRRWCRRFGRWEMVPPAIGDDVVYVTTGDVVQARRLDDGAPPWTKRVDAAE